MLTGRENGINLIVFEFMPALAPFLESVSMIGKCDISPTCHGRGCTSHYLFDLLVTDSAVRFTTSCSAERQEVGDDQDGLYATTTRKDMGGIKSIEEKRKKA